MSQSLDSIFPHYVGHHIGLDIHDIPGYSRSAPLKEGQCITIEPYAFSRSHFCACSPWDCVPYLYPDLESQRSDLIESFSKADHVHSSVHIPLTEDPRFPPAFRGLGIQIEDSICVGKSDPLILSVEAPKEVEDIEALAKRGIRLEI